MLLILEIQVVCKHPMTQGTQAWTRVMHSKNPFFIPVFVTPSIQVFWLLRTKGHWGIRARSLSFWLAPVVSKWIQTLKLVNLDQEQTSNLKLSINPDEKWLQNINEVFKVLHKLGKYERKFSKWVSKLRQFLLILGCMSVFSSQCWQNSLVDAKLWINFRTFCPIRRQKGRKVSEIRRIRTGGNDFSLCKYVEYFTTVRDTIHDFSQFGIDYLLCCVPVPDFWPEMRNRRDVSKIEIVVGFVDPFCILILQRFRNCFRRLRWSQTQPRSFGDVSCVFWSFKRPEMFFKILKISFLNIWPLLFSKIVVKKQHTQSRTWWVGKRWIVTMSNRDYISVPVWSNWLCLIIFRQFSMIGLVVSVWEHEFSKKQHTVANTVILCCSECSRVTQDLKLKSLFPCIIFCR